MRPVLVLDVPGLSLELLAHAPGLSRLAWRPLRTALPAVTCTAQSTFLTGWPPERHGVVANGWYRREEGEVAFWRQSDRLVAGEKVWEAAKKLDRSFTCAKLFWWHNMHGTPDWSVTPRPIYRADGLKLPALYSSPPSLGAALERELGPFPLHRFWGPGAGLESTEWIVGCARRVVRWHNPTLTLVYLPHLDYDLQRFGPDSPEARRAAADLDAACAPLLDCGSAVVVLSEYAVSAVSGFVPLNRLLRQAGLLAVRDEVGREALDPAASEAFAVVDHQVAHVYLKDSGRAGAVRAWLERLPGVARVEAGAHPRAGDLVCWAEPDRWFSYGWWLDDARAPDYARTVDIHRKPGYDPAELLVDPAVLFPALAVGWWRLKRALGLRALLELTPLHPVHVRGSHGAAAEGPVLLSSEPSLLPEGTVDARDVKALLLDHVFGARSCA